MYNNLYIKIDKFINLSLQIRRGKQTSNRPKERKEKKKSVPKRGQRITM